MTYFFKVFIVIGFTLFFSLIFSSETLLFISTIAVLGIIPFMVSEIFLTSLALYNTYTHPERVKKAIEKTHTKEGIIKHINFLNNPLKLGQHNIGIFTVFIISLNYMDKGIFSLSILVMMLYFLTFMVYKKFFENLDELTFN